MNASEILEENPRKEQITGGDPPWNGAKSWPRAKRTGGEKPGPGASATGGTSPPPGIEIRRHPFPPPVVREEKVTPRRKSYTPWPATRG